MADKNNLNETTPTGAGETLAPPPDAAEPTGEAVTPAGAMLAAGDDGDPKPGSVGSPEPADPHDPDSGEDEGGDKDGGEPAPTS